MCTDKEQYPQYIYTVTEYTLKENSPADESVPTSGCPGSSLSTTTYWLCPWYVTDHGGKQCSLTGLANGSKDLMSEQQLEWCAHTVNTCTIRYALCYLYVLRDKPLEMCLHLHTCMLRTLTSLSCNLLTTHTPFSFYIVTYCLIILISNKSAFLN